MARLMELDTQLAARLAATAHPTDEQFRLLVESVTEYAIFLLDGTGRVMSWNAGAERIKGYRTQDIIGQHFSVFYPPEERAAGTPERMLQRAEREARAEHEGWRLRKDGSRFWADVVISALRGPRGELRGFAKVTRDMTARRRERENEALLAAMFERTGLGIVMVDLSGRYLRANPQFLRMLGYSAEELSRLTIGELTHPDDADESWRILEELVQGRRSHAEYEKRYRRRNGQVIWARNSATRLPDADGRLRCVVATVEDITERHRADEALRESEARLQAFTSHSPAVMFLKDREGRYTFVNAQFLQRFGLRRDQVLGRTDGQLFTRAQAAAFAASDAEVLARGVPLEFEETTQLAGGARFSAVSKFPVFDAAGAVAGVGGVATDITERRKAEQALREQRTLLAEAQSLAGLGCWEWDPASGRLHWSEELYRIYGLQPGVFQPTFEGFLERVHPQDRERVGRLVAEALAGKGGSGFNFEERIVRPGGELRQLRSHGEVVRDESGRPLKVVGACLDITDHKAAEAALRALSRRLVEAQETERRRIARELHDQVGQNLSALNINLDIVLGSLQEPPLKRRLEDSLKLVDGTLQSIEAVMAELRPPLLDEYGLGAALAWYAEEYAQRTGIQVSVDKSRDPGQNLRPEAAVALFRIAQEALNNVAKHAGAKLVRIGLWLEGDEMNLYIKDDGNGFDPAQARLGRWGMTTMRERAEAAGGRFLIDSVPGRGTTVRAAVPL
jgi:PAS domain S-box-containing protein